MKKVSGPQVVTTAEASELPLPAEIQEALGELVGAARDGLLALSVGLGLRVVHHLMEAEVDEVVGPKDKQNPDRTAKRHGHEDGSMTLGGRRVEVSRPRMRTADDEHELPVAELRVLRRPRSAHAGGDGPDARRRLDPQVCRSSASRSARRSSRRASSTSKSTVSELFIERTRTALGELMSRRLDDVRLAVMMLDGLEIADRTHVVALGISTEGVKIPLGLWEGSTENATLVSMLLADLVDRGLDPEQAILFVIDGGKALRRAINDVFGEHALVHRCHRHKERNVTDLLPERDRPQILARIRGAWSLTNPLLAEERLELLASELDRTWPDAAASLREGMDDTLTLMRLGIDGQLSKTLCSTNPCESMIEIVRYTQRNVKRWQDGDMRKRWTAAGMLVAEQQFRTDHRLPRPRQARDRDRASRPPRCREQPRPSGDPPARYRVTVNPRGSSPKFHDDPGNLLTDDLRQARHREGERRARPRFLQPLHSGCPGRSQGGAPGSSGNRGSREPSLRAVTGKASAPAQGDGVEASFQGLFALVAPLGVIEHDAMVPSDDRLAAAAIPDTPTDAVVAPVDNADELIKESPGPGVCSVFDEAEMGRVRVPVLQIRDAPGSALTVHRATPVLLGDIEVSLSRNTVSLVRLLDLLAAVGANHEDVPAESKAAGSDRPGGPATIRVARKELRGP